VKDNQSSVRAKRPGPTQVAPHVFGLRALPERPTSRLLVGSVWLRTRPHPVSRRRKREVGRQPEHVGEPVTAWLSHRSMARAEPASTNRYVGRSSPSQIPNKDKVRHLAAKRWAL